MSEQDDIDRLAEHWRAERARRPTTEQLHAIVGGRQAGMTPSHLRLQIEARKVQLTLRLAKLVVAVESLTILVLVGLRLAGA